MQMEQNYMLAMMQAAKIEAAGRDCYEIAAEIARQIDAIEACWTGETATDVTQSLAMRQEEIKQMGIALTRLADQITGKAAVRRDLDAAMDAAQSASAAGTLEDAQ